MLSWALPDDAVVVFKVFLFQVAHEFAKKVMESCDNITKNGRLSVSELTHFTKGSVFEPFVAWLCADHLAEFKVCFVLLSPALVSFRLGCCRVPHLLTFNMAAAGARHGSFEHLRSPRAHSLRFDLPRSKRIEEEDRSYRQRRLPPPRRKPCEGGFLLESTVIRGGDSAWL